MGSAPLFNALQFVLDSLVGLLLFVIALRFISQLLQVDYGHPISQLIVRLTTPLRHLLPQGGGWSFDLFFFSALGILLGGLKMALLYLLGVRLYPFAGILQPLSAEPLYLLHLAFVQWLNLLYNIIFFAVILWALLSFLLPFWRHPLYSYLQALIDPLLAPIRRRVPLLAGSIDFSPMLLLIAMQALKLLLFPFLLP